MRIFADHQKYARRIFVVAVVAATIFSLVRLAAAQIPPAAPTKSKNATPVANVATPANCPHSVAS